MSMWEHYVEAEADEDEVASRADEDADEEEATMVEAMQGRKHR